MGWQEELSALDEALAAGRITPDQHRSRRDELLAAASGGGPAPMRWQAGQPSDPEQTGIIRTNQFTDSEKTQQVRPVGFPPPANQQFPQQQSGQGSRQSPPPWGEQGFDVSPNKQGMHGPEVFDSGAGKSARVGIYVLIGVLAFIVIGGGVFWFGLNGGMGETDSGASSAVTASSSAPLPPANVAAVPDPPGKVTRSDEFTLAKAKDTKIISDKDVKALEAAGVDKIFDKLGSENGIAYAVSVYVTKDENAAEQLATTLVENQVAAGLSTVEQIDVPESVSLMKIALSDQFMYRATYTSGKVTVRIATAAPSTVPEQDVAKKFNEFVKKILGSVRVG